jgi:uncharacterized membrane protein
VPIIRTLHVFGAIFLLGGVSAHVLMRPTIGRATDAARDALLQLAWRIEVLMVYVGSGLVLITGIILWLGESFKFLTGWLLLGVLLYVAAMGLDGTFLARTIRPSRRRSGGQPRPIEDAARVESSATLAAAGWTVQLVTWFLLVVVVFLMVARPF